jgi:UDP-N-acetylmuramyl tripeptide synthase
VTITSGATRLGARARVAVGATRAVNAVSRQLRLGSGTVIGGRAGLALDPGLLGRLAAGRTVAMVSGTNGKTTTTRLLAAALAAGDAGPVVTNSTGSNMPAGHVAALAAGARQGPAVLEVDEGYLPGLVRSVGPGAVVLLNLSRDQLDRTSEVRRVAGRWRAALGDAPATTVVANADDPLVAWGAGTAHRVVWVAAGLGWRLDAVGCPACEGTITFDDVDGGWSCSCGFARPAVDVSLVAGADGEVDSRWADGRLLPVVLGIPGRFNRANAVMAAAAAEALGVPAGRALLAMSTVDEVAGRFTTPVIHGVSTRLMLAKNPAGWVELLGLVRGDGTPVVVGINARVADGRDPSWLWDVPFEELRGRPVVATGERCLDLSVRLRYAEVAHETVRDPFDAVRCAAAAPARHGGAAVEFIGNYTAFHDLLGRR